MFVYVMCKYRLRISIGTCDANHKYKPKIICFAASLQIFDPTLLRQTMLLNLIYNFLQF